MTHDSVKLDPPRTEELGELCLGALSRRYGHDSSAAIPAQWQLFLPLIASLERQGNYAYGVCRQAGDHLEYSCAVEVAASTQLPEGLFRLELAPQSYLVFRHCGHIGEIGSTCQTIWSKWLPESGVETAAAPWFERYGPEFDIATGQGGVELWIPLKRTSSRATCSER